MSIQIGICDDNKEDIKILTAALYEYDVGFQIFSYENGESLLDDCEEQTIHFDIIFLDIYMPGLNGIKTAGKIRTHMRDVKIIFISSSKEHYTESYDVFAFNYIIKPLKQEKLNHILDQAMRGIINEQRQQLSFNYKKRNYRIFYRDLLYVESRDKLIFFHMSDRNTLMCYKKLGDILKQLPEKSFIRCHQSFVVNIFHVTEMGEKYFQIDKTVINISKKYSKASKDKYFEYLFDHMNRR